MVLLAGCTGSDPPAADASPGEQSSTSSPTAIPLHLVAPVVDGAHLGRSNATPVVELGPGAWTLTFDEPGVSQFVLRLKADLDPSGYSISGVFSMAILPLDFTFGACADPDINAMATGLLTSHTIGNDLDKGEYFVVVANDDATARFTWNVGSSGEERELSVKGEASDWGVEAIAEEPSSPFTYQVPRGLAFLIVRASNPPLTQSSVLAHRVDDGEMECALDQTEGGLQPLGGGLALNLRQAAGNSTTWSGTIESTQLADGSSSTLVLQGRVLVPPS